MDWRDEGIFVILGIFGGLCMIMIMILRNTPPTGAQWFAVMVLSGGSGYFSHLVLQSLNKHLQWELTVAFAVGFCSVHLGKYTVMILEDPKKLMAVFNWIRGKNG